jgi:hypothetical protein
MSLRSRLPMLLMSGVIIAAGIVVALLLSNQQALTQQATTPESTEPTSSSAAVQSPAAGDLLEVHAVGIYEGYIKSNGQIHGGRANVIIDRPGKQVILYLSAYEPVTWFIDIKPETSVAKVILGGYGRQVVKGVPEAIPVEMAFYADDKTAKDRLPYAYSRESAEFREVVKALASRTGRSLSSFQGSYGSKFEQPFVIASMAAGHDAEVMSPDYPRPTPVADLPAVTYWAPMASAKWGITEFVQFTQNGPMPGTAQAIPKGINDVAMDPASGKLYGISGHEVVELDMHSHTSTVMDMGMDVPDLSWPCGIAFDTKRQRLLVASLGGEGFLYAFDPAVRSWSVLTSMDNRDISALVYSAKFDALFALEPGRGHSGMALVKMSADGSPIGTVTLGDPIMPGMIGARPFATGAALADAGDYVAIIATEAAKDRQVVTRTFLVDPDSGQAILASVQ